MAHEGRCLVTGANGFVGAAVVRRLRAEGGDAVGAVRGRAEAHAMGGTEAPSLGADADWGALLAGCAAVVHTAARVHVLNEPSSDPFAAFREQNVAGTLSLAHQAADAGVRRFVFISSAKVHGEASAPGQPFTEEDLPGPVDAYAISKAEAEAALRKVGATTGMEVTIIRPPLVYGPGVKANFRAMMDWLRRGVPLPLGAIDNRRSLVGLDNLVDLIVTCIDHPAAANEVFLAGDGEDLSTTDLLRRLAAALGVPARLIPVPAWLLKGGLAMVGKGAVAQRLCDNLQVDISKARRVLGWNPPVSVDEGLRRAAAGFRACDPG